MRSNTTRERPLTPGSSEMRCLRPDGPLMLLALCMAEGKMQELASRCRLPLWWAAMPAKPRANAHVEFSTGPRELPDGPQSSRTEELPECWTRKGAAAAKHWRTQSICAGSPPPPARCSVACVLRQRSISVKHLRRRLRSSSALAIQGP